MALPARQLRQVQSKSQQRTGEGWGVWKDTAVVTDGSLKTKQLCFSSDYKGDFARFVMYQKNQKNKQTNKPKANVYGEENKHRSNTPCLGQPLFAFFALFPTHAPLVGRESDHTTHFLSCVLVTPLSGPRFTPVTAGLSSDWMAVGCSVVWRCHPSLNQSPLRAEFACFRFFPATEKAAPNIRPAGLPLGPEDLLGASLSQS